MRGPAERKLEGLSFANGVVVDEVRSELYLAETMGDRITGYRVDVTSGALSDRRVVASVVTPDNIERGPRGRLLVVSPVQSALFAIDPETGESQELFRSHTSESDAQVAEWAQRTAAREPALELFTAELWAPLPGAITGVITTPEGEPRYLSGLGDALVRLED
jgi:hypothetical protein